MRQPSGPAVLRSLPRNRVALVLDTLCCASRLAGHLQHTGYEDTAAAAGAMQLAQILSHDTTDADVLPLLASRLRSITGFAEPGIVLLCRHVLHYAIASTDDDGSVVTPAWARRSGGTVAAGTVVGSGVGAGIGGAVEVRTLQVALQAVKTLVELVTSGADEALSALLQAGVVWYMLYLVLSDAPLKYGVYRAAATATAPCSVLLRCVASAPVDDSVP